MFTYETMVFAVMGVLYLAFMGLILIRLNEMLAKLNYIDRHVSDGMSQLEAVKGKLEDLQRTNELVLDKVAPKKKPTAKPRNWRTAVDRAGRRMYDAKGNKISVKDRKKPD